MEKRHASQGTLATFARITAPPVNGCRSGPGLGLDTCCQVLAESQGFLGPRSAIEVEVFCGQVPAAILEERFGNRDDGSLFVDQSRFKTGERVSYGRHEDFTVLGHEVEQPLEDLEGVVRRFQSL